MKRNKSKTQSKVRAIKAFVPFETHLNDYLKSKDNVAAYLNSVLEDGTPELFLLALKDVAQAWGITKVAKRAKLGRESMYKAFKANPKIKTVDSILGALGLGFSIVNRHKKAD